MRTEVRALLFDVFGTLVDWRASIARAVEAADLEVDADAFARAWRARYQPAMQRIRSGERGFVTLDRLHRENLVETLAAFGVEGLDEAAIDRLTFAWHRLDPWEDAVPGLTRLKSRYVVAPCSNGNVALMVDLARHAGLVWDAVLGAEPAGAYKPSPQAYLRSVAMLGLEPARCMMVAAHNDDLAAAAALGLKTAFFPRPEEHGIEAGRDLGPTGPWTFVARDLVDLAERLGC
ncbi:MAG: haloacid dehalogenase type II [Geminicoccaceae bacterium]|nr:haloacid dehalogenase type II [Geminicoccaceae bacterium]